MGLCGRNFGMQQQQSAFGFVTASEPHHRPFHPPTHAPRPQRQEERMSANTDSPIKRQRPDRIRNIIPEDLRENRTWIIETEMRGDL